jgi:hypothetical protein
MNPLLTSVVTLAVVLLGFPIMTGRFSAGRAGLEIHAAKPLQRACRILFA